MTLWNHRWWLCKVLNHFLMQLVWPLVTSIITWLPHPELLFTREDLPLFEICYWKTPFPFLLVDVAYGPRHTWEIFPILFHVHWSQRLNFLKSTIVPLRIQIHFLLTHRPVVILFIWLVLKWSQFILLNDFSILNERVWISRSENPVLNISKLRQPCLFRII